MADNYNILSENTESTVVGHYERPDIARETAYQSEAELESALIKQLKRQGYEYAQIHSESELIANLRRQIEQLNAYKFSDNEWQRFFKTEIAAENKGIVDKTRTIQTDNVKTLTLDDGTQRNIYLINKYDIHANSTQVINQYEVNDGNRPNRYDVTILVNGLPLVHIELKRRGVSIKEAFNQINRYGRDSFWAGCAMFEYVQIFVVSNGTQTKYYSNTTRESHIREQGSVTQRPKIRTSNSFEFTSYWADGTNQILTDLSDFTATFFSRHTLLNVIIRYCVFTEQDLLLVMRPYQIAATEKLLNRIETAHNARRYGSREAGGFIWHTTGSGKTLTSFKAAQIATHLEYINKVLFIVDRKDLDYQTMKEYDRFQKGAANGNTSTAILKRQIEDSKSRIIITTIQKLSTFIKSNPHADIYQQEIVMIFDECHRSQFGDMHTAITRKFKKYYLFGVTGTPIFPENISASTGLLHTTSDVFGECLHTYTIVDAIRDHNVLPFRVEYIKTMREKAGIETSEVWDIERDEALKDPRRISKVTAYIIEHFNQQTKRSSAYTFSRLTNIEEVVKAQGKKDINEMRRKERLNGFNSIFAVQSIECAKMYYNEFKKQIAILPENRKLKVATIFSFAQNEESGDGVEDENPDSTENLDQSSRDLLDDAIKDYNKMFSTNYDTSADKFPNYYKDVSQRMKNREIDVLIVVNMFLTGFDATTLNTLWVDKNLRYHGLLQAFSRTNRILNSVKTAGNIVCFRNLEEATNKSLALFGDKEAKGTAILRPFKDYFNGYEDNCGKHVDGFTDMVKTLTDNYEPDQKPLGEKAEKEFIRIFGNILRMFNLISNFEQFAKLNPLNERDMQDFMSIYIDLHDKYRNIDKHDSTNINDDVVFEMELVKQIEVNIDYILFLVKKFHDSHCKDSEIRVKIDKAIDSSPDMRDKKELIDKFINSLTPNSKVDEEWQNYVNTCKRTEFNEIENEYHLKKEKADDFIAMAFERGYVPECGLELNNMMPPINPFDPDADRDGKVRQVVARLKTFFNKYFEIANGEFKKQE